jgi:hypothetical protein
MGGHLFEIGCTNHLVESEYSFKTMFVVSHSKYGKKERILATDARICSLDTDIR